MTRAKVKPLMVEEVTLAEQISVLSNRLRKHLHANEGERQHRDGKAIIRLYELAALAKATAAYLRSDERDSETLANLGDMVDEFAGAARDAMDRIEGDGDSEDGDNEVLQ